MSENPYQSPLEYTPAVGVKSGRQEDVRSVAVYQKGILVCILIYLIGVIGQFTLPPQLRPILALGVLPVGVTGLVFVFLLSTKVYHPAVGVLLGILTLVPLVGLLVLLAVSDRATRILRQNGHRVGLLGAKLSDIRASEQDGSRRAPTR